MADIGWRRRDRKRHAPGGCCKGFEASGGQVDARLAELAAGRAFNPQRSRHQLPLYQRRMGRC
jgi:hypothetical protein